MTEAKTKLLEDVKIAKETFYYVIDERYDSKRRRIVTEIYKNVKTPDNLLLEFNMSVDNFLQHVDVILTQIEGSKQKIVFPTKKSKKNEKKSRKGSPKSKSQE